MTNFLRRDLSRHLQSTFAGSLAVCGLLVAGCTDRNQNGQPDGVSQPAVDNAVSSVKNTVETVANRTSEVAQEVGANAATTAKIKTALAANESVRARDIDVTTESEKKIVILQGIVQTNAQKALAGKIAAQNAPSGFKIQNQIRVAGQNKPATGKSTKKS